MTEQNANNIAQYGLIGYPLGHSFSKQYFEQKFINEKLLHCKFNTYAIPTVEAFTTILTSVKHLKGLAVTIPYKQTIMPYLNSIHTDACIIGAVNCIHINNGYTTGYNTDVVGFEQSILPLLLPCHSHALVLGTGGASQAVQYVLGKLGVAFTLVSRHPTNKPNCIQYNQLTAALLQQHKLIINTTPLGMTPNEHSYPSIDYAQLTTQHLCYDLVYKPERTLFLQKAEAHGATIKNGYEMLICQAEQNWIIWNK